MAVTVSSRKTVSFASPYIGDTFQRLTQDIVGRDGYLFGGVASDDAVNITIAPFKFISRGIVGETLVTSGLIAVPTAAEPWFLIASMADDDPDSGIQVEVVTDLLTAFNSAIVAFKTNGQWQNPLPVSVQGAALQGGAAETGSEQGLDLLDIINGSNEVSSIQVDGGQVVDPDGIRRFVPGNSLGATITPLRPNTARDRQDYVVLRQVDQFTPVIREITGGTFDAGDADLDFVENTATTRVAYYAKRGGSETEQWFVYGDGSNIYSVVGPAGTPVVLASPGGVYWSTWIAGERSNGDIVFLYGLDSQDLFVGAFDPVTGAVSEGPVAIVSGGEDTKQIRAELDSSDQLHIVYDYSDDYSVYYIRRNAADGQGFSGLVAPLLLGSGLNSTFPDIALDRSGTSHIVFQQGAFPVEKGVFAYRTVGSDGLIDVSETYDPATSVGIETNISNGFASTSIDFFYYPRVVVTPHDEVFVSMLGEAGGQVYAVFLFSPTFEQRLGYPIVNISDVSVSEQYIGQDIMVNETGDLRIVCLTDTTVRVIGVDTIYAPGGRVGDSRLLNTQVQSGISTAFAAGQTNDPIAAQDPTGDLAYSFFHTGTVNWVRCGMWDTDTAGSRTKPTPHPRDVYLGGYYVPLDAGGVIDRDEGKFRLFNTRPKRLNFPFLVGDNGGRYQGYDGLWEAVDAAGAAGGGTVRVRPGSYRATDLPSGSKFAKILFPAGVSLVGESSVYFEDIKFEFGHGDTRSADNITGNVVSQTAAIPAGSVVRGDVIIMATSGLHRVIDVLPPATTGDARFLLSDNGAGSAPLGATFNILNAGQRFENIHLHLTGVDSDFIIFEKLHAFHASKIWVSGDTDTPLSSQGCIASVFEDIDALEFQGLITGSLISAGLGDHNVYRNIFVKDSIIAVQVSETEQYPTLENITGDGSAPSFSIINISSGRTTPVYTSNINGVVSGTIDDLLTNVSRIRTPDGFPQMEFEDINTRAGAAPDGNIKLSSATHKEFEGTGSAQGIITEAVNARLQAAGDTLLGNFDPDVDDTHRVGSWSGDLRLAEVAAAQGNLARIFVDNDEATVGDASVVPLDVKSATSQATPAARLVGRNGLQPLVVNAHGMPLPKAGFFYDDFHRYDGSALGNDFGVDGVTYKHTVVGGGDVRPESKGLTTHCLLLETGATANDSTIVEGSEGSKNTLRTHTDLLPAFAARFIVSTVTSVEVKLGFLDTSGNIVLGFMYDSSFAAELNLYARHSGGSTAIAGAGPGPVVVADTWYYVFATLISPTEILYSMGTSPEWVNGGAVTSVPGTGTILSDSCSGTPCRVETLTNAVRTAHVDMFSMWENSIELTV